MWCYRTGVASRDTLLEISVLRFASAVQNQATGYSQPARFRQLPGAASASEPGVCLDAPDGLGTWTLAGQFEAKRWCGRGRQSGLPIRGRRSGRTIQLVLPELGKRRRPAGPDRCRRGELRRSAGKPQVGRFEAGVPQPFSDPALETFLQKSGVQVIKPLQYMDRWRLDRNGIRSVPNATVKKALGF